MVFPGEEGKEADQGGGFRVTSRCAALSHCRVRLFVTPWTVAHQTPLAVGILQARILEWVVMPSYKLLGIK